LIWLALMFPTGLVKRMKKECKAGINRKKKYKGGDWDSSAPEKNYFDELIRVSKNQIIWGANHFIENIPNANTPCWIFWDKDGFGDFADGELAWCSFNSAVRKFKWTWNGFRKQQPEHRIHPTQKPVALYDWIFKNYAKPTDKILDTHLGSGSSRIAAHRAGLDFTGCEIDKDYFDAAEQRYRNFTAQLRLF
jgi:site-specific DNA-methyltransferase (adenine-specific)